MSGFTVSYPNLKKDGCCSSDCQCDKDPIDFGNIFSENALFMITKNDDLCEAYDKINANFKMLADGFLLLAEALQKQNQVDFVQGIPAAYDGTFVFNVDDQRLYVWNTKQEKYVPAYGHNSTNSEDDVVGEAVDNPNRIPNLQTLRNIFEGRSVNEFRNVYGSTRISFVDKTPSGCSAGLLVFDKKDMVLKVWSPKDNAYFPVYGGNSVVKDCSNPPKTTGCVSEDFDPTTCDYR